MRQPYRRRSYAYRLYQRAAIRAREAMLAFDRLCAALLDYPPFYFAIVLMLGALYVVGVEIGVLR